MRETSVVIATLLAAVVLKEHVTPARLTGAILVAGGVALLAAVDEGPTDCAVGRKAAPWVFRVGIAPAMPIFHY